MWSRNGNNNSNKKSCLPTAKGPFLPGCVDFMTEYTEKGFFVRLFYPTEKIGDIKNFRDQWIPWCPDISYIYGFSKVLRIMPFIIRFVIWWTSGNIHIPTLYGAKVNSTNKLKPIIFSHGLGSNRFLYSVICNELASRGYLVAVIEHRDGSASNTYYYKSKEDAKKDKRTLIDFINIDLGKDHYNRRNSQIHKRSEECEKVLDFLLGVNSGTCPENVLKDVSTNRKIDFELSDLIGHIDVDNVTMCGHSFGGATALYAITKRKQFRQAILFDPWMFPIKDEQDVFDTMQPLIFINTQTFHIITNVKAMEKLLNCKSREMYTIVNTTHENQTDTVFTAGYWLNWFMIKMNPYKAMKINNYLVLKFLTKHAPSCYSNFEEECQQYLENERRAFLEGLTKPWA